MNTLEQYRHEIDSLDAQIIRALGNRFEVCRKIAEFKREQVIPMMQYGRVEEVKRRCAELGTEYGIDPELVLNLYTLIINESCRMEDKIIGDPESISS